jgi:cytochrome b561
MVTPTTGLIVVAVIPLVIWRLYSRIRRMVGRQKSQAWRHWAAATLFPLAILLLGISAAFHPLSLASLVGGVAVGAALATYGLRMTRFEATGDGFFYTPNAHIGIALSLLLVARILYRLVQIYALAAAGSGLQAQEFARSPLTLVIVGMIGAYYTVYAAGVLRWRRAQQRQAAPDLVIPP